MAVPWLAFERDFPWSPAPLRGRVTVMFRAGHVILATRAAAAMALAKGVARQATEAEIDVGRQVHKETRFRKAGHRR